MDFCQKTDEQLVNLIKKEDNESLHILIKRYNKIIHNKASILCPFADTDDMVQEGIIALYSAVIVYDETISSFSTFANLCIERSMISAYRKIFNKKNISQNTAVSINEIDKPVIATPESLIIEKEDCLAFTKRIKNTLSTFEYKVLCEYLNNNSYDVIALNLNSDKKAINNAMTRIRNKIKAIK
jgi:RNA polymerase sporulation-specific sigma factor